MKSTPYQLRFYYLAGHEKNPLIDQITGKPKEKQPVHAGVRNVGGFNFTDGAMRLYLPKNKSERNARHLRRAFGVLSEVIKDVDVPTRKRTFSPQSEAEGVLGLVDAGAPISEGHEAQGSGNAGPGNPDAASLEAVRRGRGEQAAKRGSSVASKATVDPAARAALLNEKEPPGQPSKAAEGTEGLT